MGNWLGWSGPLFERPVTGVGRDGGNKRQDTYTETLIQVEPGATPGRYDALIWVRGRGAYDKEMPNKVVRSLKNADLGTILARGDSLTAEVTGQITERVSRRGRSMHVDRTGPYTGGGGGYRSGGEPDPSAQNW